MKMKMDREDHDECHLCSTQMILRMFNHNKILFLLLNQHNLYESLCNNLEEQAFESFHPLFQHSQSEVTLDLHYNFRILKLSSYLITFCKDVASQ